MTASISVITPSFNQAQFLPRALDSVAAQTFQPIEHLVYDPGSSDGSRNIARAAYGVTLIAEPDAGQADAVARGMLEAAGDIVAWLNSDDEYFDSDVFAAVAEAFDSDESPDIVFGDGVYVDEKGEHLRDAYVISDVEDLTWRLAKEVGILQPATFISKRLIERIGPVDRELHFCMDYEFWIRAQQSGAKFFRLHRPLARARYYSDNKTLGLRRQSFTEVIRMVKGKYGFAHFQWVKGLADYELHSNDGILKHHAHFEEDRDAVALAAFERYARQLNRLVNGDFPTYKRLLNCPNNKAVGQTLDLLSRDNGYHSHVYAKSVLERDADPPGSKCYTVGDRRWAFDRQWLDWELSRSDRLLESLAAKRKSDVCVIAGNGPSLIKTDFELMGAVDVFIANYAFINEELAKVANFLCVTNFLVAEQESESFNLLSGFIKFHPYWLSYCLPPSAKSCLIRSVGYPEFGVDYRENISWRSTVSFFAMQIAYALGYKKVLLVGFDHSYTQPKSVEGEIIDQKEDDPNHFDPKYFKGKKWQAADVDNMEAMYLLSKEAFESDGREIVNCTVGGQLEIFRRSDLKAELITTPPSRLTSDDLSAAAAQSLLADIQQHRHRKFVGLDVDAFDVSSLSSFERLREFCRDEQQGEHRKKLQTLKKQIRGKTCHIFWNGSELDGASIIKMREGATIVPLTKVDACSDAGISPLFAVGDVSQSPKDLCNVANRYRNITKLISSDLRLIVEPDAKTFYFDDLPDGRISADVSQFIATETLKSQYGALVTSVELALYMGFTDIKVVGGVTDSGLCDAIRRACGKQSAKLYFSTEPARLPGREPGSDAPIQFRHPRLLLIDMTRIGNATATGEIKAAIFKDWPRENLMQIFDAGSQNLGLLRGDKFRRTTSEEIYNAVDRFSPDIVLYRPTPDQPALHACAVEIIERLKKPLALWIMDDWPTALESKDPAAFSKLDSDWRALIAQSTVRFAISESMSNAFEKRYGVEFTPIANGVDPAHWPPAALRNGSPIKVRYAGSLAENMTLHSVALVAKAVEQLSQEGVDISFEIKTREMWRRLAAPSVKDFKATSFVVADLSQNDYRAWLSDADIVVIGYNFDDASKSYIKYSLANKLPECLASGAALLAVGPADVATLEVLEEIDCGVRLLSNDVNEIADALRELARSPEKRFDLAQKAQRIAFKDFHIDKARARLAFDLSFAASSPFREKGLPREAHANVDETEVVALLLSNRKGRKHVMLDVGAHYGESAGFFEPLGWTIHCFEPDPGNRSKLKRRHGEKANITIDSRAVGEEKLSAVSFYASEESSGISSLTAFRESHKEKTKVDVTTVADIIREHSISHIDFLKIDVEGFDFAVLKGVPWDQVKPDIIECEYEDSKTVPLGHSWKDIADYLHDKGYTVYISEWHPISRYGVAHDWRRIVPYPDIEAPTESWGNFLAFREDFGYEAVCEAFASKVALRRERAKSSSSALKSSPEPGGVQTKTPDVDAVNRPFYAAFGDRIRMRFPRAFYAIRFARRALAGVWRRRLWTFPSLALLAGAFMLGVAQPQFEERLLIWGISAFATLLFALAYLALRTYQVAAGLTAEIAYLRRKSEDQNARLSAADRKVQALKSEKASLETKLSRHIGAVRKSFYESKTQFEATNQSVRASAKELRKRLDEMESSFETKHLNLDRQLTQKVVVANRTAKEDLKETEKQLKYELKVAAFNRGLLRERIASSERQITNIRFPNAPKCLVFFGHHKCASRFFRYEVFAIAAEATGAHIRKYEVKDPPFHYSMSDELDLLNIDFDGLGEGGRDIVLFSNATERSLDRIRRETEDWKGLRVLRDPRQVLVSNYFHHKGSHDTAANGWVWDQLVKDQPILRELPEEDGLIYELDNISKQIIDTQILASFDDERVKTIRIEDFSQDASTYLQQISEFLGVADIAGIDFNRKGANPDSGTWQDHFTPRLREIFKERYGQALIDLGYAQDFDW